jgi:hypothetical protein
MHGLRNWHYTSEQWAQDVMKAVSEGKPMDARTVALARKTLGMAEPPCVDVGNIFQVIAAVAADNLMRCSIAMVNPKLYRVEIVDGMGHALTQPVEVHSTYAAVQKCGIWWVSYRCGEWAQDTGTSGGNGNSRYLGSIGWWDNYERYGKGIG